MKILNLLPVIKFKKKHQTARKPLNCFVSDIKNITVKNFSELKKIFGKRVDKLPKKYGHDLYCFDIKGNDFRLIAVVTFKFGQLYVKEILTHKEYSKKYCSGK